MKNVFLWISGCSGIVALVLILGCIATKNCGTGKGGVGVIDEQKIVTSSAAFKTLLGDEQKYQNALTARQAEDEKMLQAELVALEKKIKDSGKPQSAFKKEVAQFQQKVAYYNQKYQLERRLIARAANAARQQLDPAVQSVLTELTEKGYSVIVSKTNVMQYSQKADVTEQFVKLLDAKNVKVVFPDPLQFAVAQNAIAQQAAVAKAATQAAEKAPVAQPKAAAPVKADEGVKETPAVEAKTENKETKK